MILTHSWFTGQLTPGILNPLACRIFTNTQPFCDFVVIQLIAETKKSHSHYRSGQ